MNSSKLMNLSAAFMSCLLLPHAALGGAKSVDLVSADNLWARSNLVAWEAAPYDGKKRSPEERAQMLERLAIRQYAYLPSGEPWGLMDDVNTSQLNVDAEIEAMQKHGISILAWYFWANADDPVAVPHLKETLESFKRHHIHPQIWITHSFEPYVRNSQKWAKFLPPGVSFQATQQKLAELSVADRLQYGRAFALVDREMAPTTPAEAKERVTREAMRIRAFVEFVKPYGCTVNIYNHRGWFGMIDNELLILQELTHMGVTTVGLVYNFSHARDSEHDDSRDFATLWKRIRSHVSVVNVVGLSRDMSDGSGIRYPSQGEYELGMMRAIQVSGWRGPVGILGWGDDAEVSLRNALRGVDWIGAELRQPRSAGPRPSLEN